MKNRIDRGLKLVKKNGSWRIVEFSYYSGRVLKIIKKQDKNWDYNSLLNYLQGAEDEQKRRVTS